MFNNEFCKIFKNLTRSQHDTFFAPRIYIHIYILRPKYAFLLQFWLLKDERYITSKKEIIFIFPN